MAFYREQLDGLRVTKTEELADCRNNQHVRVAGLVTLRQRPSTAKGITFVTLEDETGSMNLVMQPEIWQRHYKVARRSNSWLAHGILENREGIIHILIGRIEDLSDSVGELENRSRDFH